MFRITVAIALTFWLIASKSAFAHERLVGSSFSLEDWSFDPWLVLPLSVIAILYVVGCWRLWRRAGIGRGLQTWKIVCFWLGWCVAVLALMSPLHSFAEQLLTAHMIEHELLMAVAAPLLVVSRPLVAFLWAAPTDVRRWAGQLGAFTPLVAAWSMFSEATVATGVHIGTILAWHTPRSFQLALVVPTLHMLQHLTFFGTALLFWWALLKLPRRQHGLAGLHLFFTMMALSMLGALLTLAQNLWYPAYSSPITSLTALEDQQLAGLVMWIPGCAVYAIAAVAFMASWISSPRLPSTGRYFSSSGATRREWAASYSSVARDRSI